MDIDSSYIDNVVKNNVKFYCEIQWLKGLDISKGKLPDYFSDLFGKKEGYHSIKLVKGFKLKDLLEYPTNMQKDVFADMNDKAYTTIQ